MEDMPYTLLMHYPVLAPLLFILLRAVPVIIPPIPGIAFDLLGIAVFGWKLGLVLALIGGHLGAIVAFYLARYYRDFVARYLAPIRTLHRLEDRYSEKEKFWMLIAVRFVTSPIFDYVNYVAGFTKMSFGKYILSTCIGVLPYSFCIYYFGTQLLMSGWVYALFAGVGILIVLSLFQERLLTYMGKRLQKKGV